MDLQGVWTQYRYPLAPDTFEDGFAVGPDGRVWVNILRNDVTITDKGGSITKSRTEGILMFDQQRWTFYTLRDIGLPSSLLVRHMVCDNIGRLWLYLHPKTLCRFDSQTTEVFRSDEGGLPAEWGNVSSLVSDEKSGVWVAMSAIGVCHFDNVTWEIFTPQNSRLTDKLVTSMTLDGTGRVWFAVASTNETRFVWYDKGRWEECAKVPIGLKQGEVQGLAVDKADILWVGWGGGWIADPEGKRRPQLWALPRSGGSWRKYNARNPVLKNLARINNIVIDNRGRVWLGPGIGLGIIEDAESVCWEIVMPGVQHGPLSRKNAARRQWKDKRPDTLIGGYLAIDKLGRIWTTSRGKDNWGLCVFTEK